MSAQKAREHLRCPCCGRLAVLPPGGALPPAFRADHALDAQVQTFTGGGRGAGFAWEARDLTDEEREGLAEIVSNVAARLGGREVGDAREGAALAPSPPAVSTKMFEDNVRLKSENARLKRQNEKFKEALRLAAEHIRNRRR